MKNGLLTIELNRVHCNLVPGHDDGPVARVGHDGRQDFDAAVAGRRSMEPELPLLLRTVVGGSCPMLLIQTLTVSSIFEQNLKKSTKWSKTCNS